MQASNRVHVPSIATLAISGFGLLAALAGAAGLFVSGMVAALTRGVDSRQVLSMFSLAWISGLVAVLLVPVLASALMRLFGKNPQVLRLPVRGLFTSLNITALLMVLWPVAAVLGELISRSGKLDWLLLPPIQIYVVAVPLWWLLELGRRELPSGGPQRSWSILGFSLVITPVVILIIESVLIVGVAVLVAVFIFLHMGPTENLSSLLQRLVQSGADPSQLETLLQPILSQPMVIYGLLAMTAGVIPLIEELFKPLALWGFIGRRLTPAEGFSAGLVCGFCFGLVESLSSVSSPAGSAWLFMVVGRFGTGLLHTLSAGLVGWGLASAWGHGRYLRLGGIFLACAGLHGTWNFFSLLMGISGMLSPASPGLVAAARAVGVAAPYALVGLSLAMFVVLILVNRALRSSPTVETAAPAEPPVAVPAAGAAFAVPAPAAGEEPPEEPITNEEPGE
jgi:hypothetical protein